MIQSIPQPKLILVSGDRPQAQPKTKDPADFRWGLVEEFLRSRELSANSRKAYSRNLREFLNWTDKGLNQISARDIDRYKEHLKTLPSKRGGTLSTATINQYLYSLQSFFRWLTAREYIERDPMLMLEKLKPDPVRSLEWSDDEVKALFEVLPQREQTLWRDQAMLWILLHGLRASEVAALNIQDFDGKRLHILEAKDDSVGTVPLLAEGIEAIENYMNWRVAESLPVDKELPLLLSHSRNSYGERLGYSGVYKAVKAIAELAGVSNSFPHRGRHTMATNLVLRGVDPMLARQITRHKSEKSFGRYSKRALEVEAERQFYQVFGES